MDRLPLPRRTRLPHTPPDGVAADSRFFISVNAALRYQNTFCHPDTAAAIFDSVDFYNRTAKWNCQLLLLMPDHLHGLVSFPKDPGISITMTRWKGFLAKEHGIRWQQGFFDHRLRDHWQVVEKTDYILQNPIRKGLCQAIAEWPYVFRSP